MYPGGESWVLYAGETLLSASVTVAHVLADVKGIGSGVEEVGLQ